MINKKIQKNIILLIAVIIISKFFGMIRDVVLAYYYGTTKVSDAYIVASSIPMLLFCFIGQAIATAYIPMYNKVKKEQGVEQADLYSNNIANISLLFSTFFIAVLFIYPQPIVKLFAVGFDSETSMLAARLVRISAASLYFMVLVSIGGGYLQINNNFLVPAAISLPRNIVIILSIVLAYLFDVALLGWGFLLAYLSEVIFLLLPIRKLNYRYKPYINFKDGNVKETLYVILPIIIGVGVNQIKNIVSKSIASTISEGAISALDYAFSINSAIQEILVTGVIAILFADSAAHVANEEHDKVKNKLSRTIKGIVMILLPATIGIIILSRPIVIVFFSRGNFNEQSVIMTTASLQLFSVGLIFTAIRDTLIKVFYAYRDTKTSMIISIISITVNIILSLILSRSMGVQGLALASSTSAIFHCITMYIFLNKKIGDFYLKDTIRVLIKSIVSGAIMAVAILPLYNTLIVIGVSSVLSFAVTVLSGIIIYSACAIAFKIEPAMEILSMLKK